MSGNSRAFGNSCFEWASPSTFLIPKPTKKSTPRSQSKSNLKQKATNSFCPFLLDQKRTKKSRIVEEIALS